MQTYFSYFKCPGTKQMRRPENAYWDFIPATYQEGGAEVDLTLTTQSPSC